MESQKPVKAPNKPATGHKEAPAPEQTAPQFDSFSAILAARKASSGGSQGGGEATSPPPPKSGGLSPQHIARLQRTIGNQATNRLLRKEDTSTAPTPTPAIQQSTLHSAPDSSIQRDLFGFKKRKQKRETKERTEWDTRLTGYVGANLQVWQDSIYNSVEAEMKKKSQDAIKGWETDIRAKALGDVKTPLDDSIQDIQDDISNSTDEEKNRKDQFRVDRLQYNTNQSTGQVNAALKAKLVGEVTKQIPGVIGVVEVQEALDKIAENVETELNTLVTSQDKNTPKTEKEFNKEVKKKMEGDVTTGENGRVWGVINTYLQDQPNKDTIVQSIATEMQTTVTDIHTQEGTKKDAWNNKLEAIETRVLGNSPGEDWPGNITTTVTSGVEKSLKENLRSDDRRQKLMVKLKAAIDAQVTIIEGRLNTQMGGVTDPVAKERLRLEKENVKERFGDKAKELVEENEPEYQRTIDETVTALLAREDVKKDLDAKAFVTSKVRGLLDPKRENTENFSRDVEKKINKELAALKPTILKEWTTSSEQKITTYLSTHETRITNIFKAKMGITDTGATHDRVETAGRDVVEGMDTGDQTSKGTVDEAYLKELYKSSVLTPVTEYLSNKFGKEGMSWNDFRSEKAKEFRKRMKDVARQQAYKEIETEKDTHAKTSSMTDTGKKYIGHLAKNKAYKYAKESLNEQMGVLAAAEAEMIVPEANVLFELDMAWRDAVTAARDAGKRSGAQTTAGKAAAKTRATALFEEYKVIAKDRKNELFGKTGSTAPQYVQNVAPTPQSKTDIETGVEGKITKDRVANRSITKAIEADSVTQGYNKTANLINFFLPTPGDEVKFDIQLRIPVYSEGIVKAFVLFYLMGKAGRETLDEVKVALSVGVGGGLSFWGGESTFKVGYFIEAQADTASKVGMLMSYGTYRQMSSAGPINLLPKLAHALWGGAGIKYDEKDQPGGTSKTENTSKNFAEMWAAMVEETAMQRHFLPSKLNPGTDTPALGDDAYREKDGRLAVTKVPVAPGKTEGREYLGKVTHVAESKKSISVGDFSFTYDENAANPSGSQAVKAAPGEQIGKGTEIYAKDWTGVGTVELTTQESSTGKKHQALGKVKEISPGGKRLLIDTKSSNYVDVGMLVEAAGNVNFGVGKAEGVATYKQLSRFSKKVIDRMTQDKFGKYDPSGQKLKDLGTQNRVLGGAGGERRYIGELEGKTEIDFGPFKASMGIGLKLVFSDLDRFHVSEFEGQGSFGLPSQFLDEAPKEANEWASKVGGPFVSALKTIIARGMESRKKVKELRDDTGDPGKETGILVDTAFDISVPTVHLIGDGGNPLNEGNPSLYDKLVESGGDTDKNETVNDTVRQMFPGQEEGSSKIGGAVKKFAMKNELTVTAKYGWDHGRSKFTVDIKQTKGGEVDLGLFKAKIEKSKELIKFGGAQDDRKFKASTNNPPTGGTVKGTKVYFAKTGTNKGKITLTKGNNELAGTFVKVDGDIVTVRAWAPTGNIMGYAL